MLTSEQRITRLGRIGSSQIAAAIGLHPHKTPFAVWEEVTGRSTFDGNTATRRGEILESAIVQIFEDEHPGLYCMPGETIIGPEDWIVDTPDRYVLDRVGRVGVLEIKAVGPWNAAGWTMERVPDHVELQLRWHMLCTDTNQGWVVGFFNLQDVRAFHFQRDAALDALLLQRGREWYEAHVVTDTPPARKIDGSDESARYARAHFKRQPVTREIDPASDEATLLAELRDVTTARKHLDQREAALRNELAMALKGDSVSMPGASFTLQARKTVAWQKVARALDPSPELIDQHTTESASYVARFNGGSNE